jgi:hypothetical protein
VRADGVGRRRVAVALYENSYWRCYVRGPAGIVELAEKIS